MRTTLETVGPDAPTLCEGWTAADVAAHLAFADVLGGTMAVGGRVVARRFGMNLTRLSAASNRRTTPLLRRRGFEWATAHFARQPPRLLCAGAAGAVTLCETFVHHEDIRRANGMGPRAAADQPELMDALAFILRYQRRTFGGARVTIVAPDQRTVSSGDAGAAEQLTLTGPIGEALLWLSGRGDAAEVEAAGSPDVIDRFTAETLAI